MPVRILPPAVGLLPAFRSLVATASGGELPPTVSLTTGISTIVLAPVASPADREHLVALRVTTVAKTKLNASLVGLLGLVHPIRILIP